MFAIRRAQIETAAQIAPAVALAVGGLEVHGGEGRGPGGEAGAGDGGSPRHGPTDARGEAS